MTQAASTAVTVINPSMEGVRKSRSNSLTHVTLPDARDETFDATASPSPNQPHFMKHDTATLAADTSSPSAPPTELPSEVARREIAKARRLSEHLSSSSRSASPIVIVPSSRLRPRVDAVPPTGTEPSSASSSSSLVSSLFSLGGAVWKFIRGPVDTVSYDDPAIVTSTGKDKSPATQHQFTRDDDCDSDGCSEVSSDPPNFDYPLPDDTAPRNRLCTFSNASADAILVETPVDSDTIAAERRLGVEPGRDKITICESDLSVLLARRDFSADEHLLTSADVAKIHFTIPARWRMHSCWLLLYSTRGNGFSLATLYSSLRGFKGPVIVALRDYTDAVFGVFANQPLQPRQGHYGTGECFLWRKDGNGAIIKYPSTGKNNYFLISESDYLAVGCGGGKFGLWLDRELLKGTSDPVPTFDNEQLSGEPQFECTGMEIWGLDLTN